MIGVIIQARTGSSRFPRKIYEDLNGKNTLYRVLDGVRKAESPHRIILAMPEYDRAEFETMLLNKEFEGATDDRFRTYFGNSDNLVDRYLKAARQEGIDLIVRVTADCPMIQGNIIDEMLFEYSKNGYNGLMSNNPLVSPVPFPDGIDVEIFKYEMICETAQLTTNESFLEHVTPFMYRRGTEYNLYGFENRRPNTMISNKFDDFSFDTEEDYRLLMQLTKHYDENGEDLNTAIKLTNFNMKG